MPSRNLKIADLLLDHLNPRNEPASSQRQALQQIIDDQDIKLAVLAEHIIENGASPIDLLLVVKDAESQNYTVLEGNRRTAVLKILANPAVLTGLEVRSALKKRLESAASDFNRAEVEPLTAFEVATREEGNRWIDLKHNGENGGSGIVNWQGIQRARFSGGDPALQALDFVVQHGNLTDDQKQTIADGRFITTLDRLLSTPDVRAKLGVTVKKGKLLTDLPADEIIKPLRRIVLDLAGKKVNVTKLKKKDQQIKYVAGFDASSRPDTSKRQTERALNEIDASQFASPVRPVRIRRKADSSDRRTVIPKGCNLTITDNRIAQIYRELRILKLEDAPNAIAVLTRVFLELSVEHYLVVNGVALSIVVPGQGDKDKSLRKKFDEAIAHMKANGVPDKELQGVVRALSVAKSPLYIDLLNDYVHNKHVSPAPSDLKAAWDTAQSFFQRIWQ